MTKVLSLISILPFHSLINMTNKYQYETVKVDVSAEGVAHVQLNRPKKLNAFNDQ
jgi:1,4-dihydroxy-2-naphthoyl-CoA synthase